MIYVRIVLLKCFSVSYLSEMKLPSGGTSVALLLKGGHSPEALPLLENGTIACELAELSLKIFDIVLSS